MNFPEKFFLPIIIAISTAIFLGFGLFHLTKFETVDEHFWKYDRIGDYIEGWEGWVRTGNTAYLKKTHINDKPGVTVAIASAPGFFFGPNPEEHRLRTKEAASKNIFTIYDTEKTETINFFLRLPILLFGAAMIILLSWLALAASGSRAVAALFALAAATTPALVGISQIINPDAMLWSLGAGAIFSYVALLRTGKHRFLWICTAALGGALLSKYTAGILFLFFLLAAASKCIFSYQPIAASKGIRAYILRELRHLAAIGVGALTIFSLLMPSVFFSPSHLWEGTFGSPALAPLTGALFVFIALLLADAFLWKSRGAQAVTKFLSTKRVWLVRAVGAAAIFLAALPLANVWTGGNFIPLENIKESAYEDGDLAFPVFSDSLPAVRQVKEIIAEAHPIIFTLTPAVILLLLIGWTRMLIRSNPSAEWLPFFFSLLIPVYIFGALLSGVFLTPRYGILLYPIAAFLAALFARDAAATLAQKKFCTRKAGIVFFAALILASGIYALWTIRPHYLNYTSVLLPRQFVVVDSWGYGMYEAAQYLNALPNAEDIVIWSDRSAICQFLRGRCIRDYKIDLSETIPDYFVFTRRGSIRHPFVWRQPELARVPSEEYYRRAEKEWEWQLTIGGRERNFVKIIRSEEK